MFLELLGLVIIASMLMTVVFVCIYAMGELSGINDAFKDIDYDSDRDD